MFDANSRYYRKGTKIFLKSDGTGIAYVERRFLPRDENLTILSETRVSEGDRLDLISARFYGDPTQHWRLLDAQHTHLDPAVLLEDRDILLKIPLPEAGQ